MFWYFSQHFSQHLYQSYVCFVNKFHFQYVESLVYEQEMHAYLQDHQHELCFFFAVCGLLFTLKVLLKQIQKPFYYCLLKIMLGYSISICMRQTILITISTNSLVSKYHRQNLFSRPLYSSGSRPQQFFHKESKQYTKVFLLFCFQLS